MNFNKEIRKYKCELSADQFSHHMLKVFDELFPGLPLEQLGFYPVDGIRYCVAVRRRTRASLVPEHVIMHRLTNLRKQGATRDIDGPDRPATRKGRQGIGRKFAEELREHGYGDDAGRFDESIISVFGDMFGDIKPEHLLFTPTQAMKYCMNVRHRTHDSTVPDDIILRRLTNLRKHPKMSP